MHPPLGFSAVSRTSTGWALAAVVSAACLAACDDAGTPAATGDDDAPDQADATEAPDDDAPPDDRPRFAPVTDAAGAYAVASREVVFTNEAQGRELPGIVWYPTEDPPGEPAWYQGLVKRPAVRDHGALPPAGRFPVVVFSHGSHGFAEQSFSLTEYLASHGFVVAAPNHIGNTTGTQDDDRMAWMSQQRPRDLSIVIDWLETWAADPAHFLHDRLDLARLAVVGHSFGGFTALAIAGAAPQADAIAAACDEPAPEGGRPKFCSLMGDTRDPSLDWSLSGHDARVKAAVSMAPAGYPLWGPAGLAAVRVPVAVMTGLLDVTVPPHEESLPIYEHLPAPKGLLLLPRGGHFTFSNMCAFFPAFGDGCGAEYIPFEQAQPIVAAFTAAFLRLALYGAGGSEAQDAAWLAGQAQNAGPDVEWRSAP